MGPHGLATLTSVDFCVLSDSGYLHWIVAKLDDTLGVVYEAAHNVEAGMVLVLDRDSQSSDDQDGNADCGVCRRAHPLDMHVRRTDGSFCGLLRERQCGGLGEETSGLQAAQQEIPSEELQEATYDNDTENLQQILEKWGLVDASKRNPRLEGRDL